MVDTLKPRPECPGSRLASLGWRCFSAVVFVATVKWLFEDHSKSNFCNPSLDYRHSNLSTEILNPGEKPFKSMHNKRILVACSPAQPNCADCNSATPQLCTSCLSTHILSPASTCELPCNQKQYNLYGSCQNCATGCRNCWGQSDNCTECYYGLKTFQHQASPPLFKCIPTCKANEWYSFANNSCVQCPYLCTTCTSSTRCTACTAAATLNAGTGKCEIICPTGSYRDSNNVCQTCDAWCATCSGSSSNCLTCSGSGVNAAPDCKTSAPPCAPGHYASGGTCVLCSNYPRVQNCTFTTYEQATGCKNTGNVETDQRSFGGGYAFYLSGTYCQQAPFRCIYATSSSCTTCAPGYTGANCDTTLPSPSCGTGTYASVNNDACIPCSENCLTCTNGDTQVLTRYSWSSYPCHNCPSPWWNNGGMCQEGSYNCRIDQFSPIGATSPCSFCDSTCRTCFGAATNCTSCHSGFYLSGNTCVAGATASTCPAGQVLYNGQCYACPANCEICESALIPTRCYQCLAGYTYDSATQTCNQCHQSCAHCNPGTPSVCAACRANAQISGGICVCDTGFRMDASYNCQACSTGCATCPDGPALCDSCKAGFTHDSVARACQMDCSAGSYPSSLTTCSPCPKPCSTCLDGTGSKCTNCIPGASLTGTSPASCSCDSGTFFHAGLGSCQGCDPSCLECTAAGVEGCSACTAPKNLYTSPGGKKCIDPTCPAQQYFNTGTLACMACDPSCDGCNGSGSNSCNSCATNYALVSSNCISTTCAVGSYFNPSTGCQICPTGCTACTYGTPVVCSACSSSYYLSAPACMPCDSSCATCSGAGPTACATCTLPLVIQSSQCVTPTSPPAPSPLPVPPAPAAVLTCSAPQRLVADGCRTQTSPSASFDISSKTLTFSFGLTALNKPVASLSTLFVVTVHSKDAQLFSSATVSPLEWHSSGASISASVTFTADLIDGFVRVAHSDTNTVLLYNATHFVDPKVVVQSQPFSVLTSTAGAAVEATTTALSNSIGPAQTTAMLVATPLSASAGTLLQKLANFFEFLIYLNGRRLIYPDMVLKAVGISLIPIEFDNYLQVDEREVDCTPSPNYADNDVSCNILNNFGKDILFLGLVLAITLVITLLKRVAVATIKNPNNIFLRFVLLLHDKFGPVYFMIVFEGSNSDLVCFGLVNIFFYTDSKPQRLGLMAGIVSVLGVSVIAVLSGLFVRDFLRRAQPEIRAYLRTKQKLESEAADTNSNNKDKDDRDKQKEEHKTRLERCVRRVDAKKAESRWAATAFLVEEYRPELNEWYYMWPSVTLLKNVLCQLLLVSLAYEDMHQVLAIFLLQAAYTVYICFARPKFDALENWVNIVSAVLFTVYILLVWIVNQGVEERVAQNVYGLVMAGILITIVLVNLFMIIWTIGCSLLIVIKELWDYFSKRPAKAEIPEFEEDLPNSDDMRTVSSDQVANIRSDNIDQSELKSIGTTTIVEKDTKTKLNATKRRLKKVKLTAQNMNHY